MNFYRNISCYVLRCEGGKFYTGSTPTHRLQERFEEHRTGAGSKWCRKYPPIEIVKTTDRLLSQEGFRMENTECKRIMREHNDIQCCRGGDYLFPETDRQVEWWSTGILT